ncbi:MAG: hypothetical protein PHY43_03895 [Verrucomicrobiales bacterium]|nr:hypothetical protein [Verrucomicrobiales bacterium]
MNRLKIQTVTVAAYANGAPGSASVQMPGSMFYCKKADDIFRVGFDNNSPVDCEKGFKFRDPNAPFEKIFFFNDTANAFDIQFYVGDGSVDYVGTNKLRPEDTVFKGGKFVNLGNGSVNNTPAQNKAVSTLITPGSGAKHCKTLIISCPFSSANQLLILDVDGNTMFSLKPDTAYPPIESGAPFRACGDGGGADLYVGQLIFA